MNERAFPAVLLALALAGCVVPSVPPPGRADFSADLIVRKEPGPPPGPEGACWQADIRPAVIETVTEQVLVQPEKTGPDGAAIPAVYGTSTSQRIVSDRDTVWFRAPCPEDLTVHFVASLQRALKARGLFLGPVTAVLDGETAEAVRRFQAARGLDSPTLSLAAARALGLSSADLEGL